MTLDVVGSTIFGVRFNCVQSKGADAVKAARIIFGSASPFTLSGNPYILLAMMSPSFVHPLIEYVADRFPTKGMKRIQWAAQVMGTPAMRCIASLAKSPPQASRMPPLEATPLPP